ncbi:MAG: serine hydrolase [Bacteriovorax sp.]|nr:serine hydrolase [Bacteriovorax sp.]
MNKTFSKKFSYTFYKILISCILIGQYVIASADVIDSSGIRWPIPDWGKAQNNENVQAKLASKQCLDFFKFSTKNKKFLTEGLVVIRKGTIEYEGYDSKYGINAPHVLWSISKTITGALLGVAIRDGKITLDQKLNEFYPRPDASDNYQKIKIENLFYLDTGFLWNEYYSGNVRQSPVLNMLYGTGHADVADFASRKEIISEGPGYKWNYSTGTPAITMGVLKSVYGKEYDEMPWKLFFNPLSINRASFERDHRGVFNGGSSAFATPREMAKIGYLYLNRGMWNGEEILTEDWIEKTLKVSPGYISNGTVIRDITDDGVYGGSIWLNRSVKKGFGKPYPTSPEDMFLALGHYGQMIIVLPSQDMVIARTGYDQEYNSNVDEFVSRAISCFDDPKYPIGKNIPPPAYSKNSILAILNTLKSALQTKMMQATVAKTICSCHFISGLDVNTCLERSNIPVAKQLTTVFIKNNTVYSEQSKFANFFLKVFGLDSEKKAQASFNKNHPEFGCTLK